jgi:hypothetical protein
MKSATSWDEPGTSRGWRHLATRKITELDARIPDAQRAKELIAHALECLYRDLFTCPRFRAALEAQHARPVSEHP